MFLSENIGAPPTIGLSPSAMPACIGISASIAVSSLAGSRTASITWITPFD